MRRKGRAPAHAIVSLIVREVKRALHITYSTSLAMATFRSRCIPMAVRGWGGLASHLIIGGTNYVALTREDRGEGRNLSKKGNFSFARKLIILKDFAQLSQDLLGTEVAW